MVLMGMTRSILPFVKCVLVYAPSEGLRIAATTEGLSLIIWLISLRQN